MSAPALSRASRRLATPECHGLRLRRLDPEDLEHVLRARHGRRAEPEQRIRAGRERARDLARHRKHLAPLLEREVRRDQGAAALARLDHHRRPTEAGDDPVAGREAPGCGLDAGLVLGDDETRLADPSRELGVRGRIVAIDAASEHGDRHAAGIQRATMGLAVDASGHAAHDDETGRSEVAARASA